MKKSEAIMHFGSQTKLATAINVSQAAVSKWSERIPELRAYQIERLTNGQLTAVPPIIHSDDTA